MTPSKVTNSETMTCRITLLLSAVGPSSTIEPPVMLPAPDDHTSGDGQERRRRVRSGAPRSERLDRFPDPALAGLGGLRPLDRQDVSQPAAIGRPLEAPPCVRIMVEDRGEVGRYRDSSWLGVEGDIELDIVSSSDPGALAVLRADRQQEPTAPRRSDRCGR